MKSSVATLSAIAFALTMQASRSAQAADPTTSDCLTASDNAVALRNQHKLRAARAQQLVCGAASCPADIRVECLRRVEELNAAVPTAIFQAKDAAGNDIIAVKVTMDGDPLAERLEGTPISLDPGPHSFTFEMAGQAPVTKTLVIQESQKDRRETIVFGLGAAAPPGIPATPPAQPAPVLPQPAAQVGEAPPTSSGNSTKRIVGLVIGGVGVVAAGVAIFEQVTALGHDSDSKSAAASHDPAVQGTVHTLHEQALDAQTFAIVSATIGVVAIGTGAYLLVTSSAAPPAAKETGWQLVPELAARGGGLVLKTTW
ncbi:MAG TPA: hypothetical protein VGY54_14445 [Polyangiaceae bacterium]|jgi:hypothetical protein|nr:hypothetical protein [Polyangiaceae bacterium]